MYPEKQAHGLLFLYQKTNLSLIFFLMQTNSTIHTTPRDYSTISPSARALLFMKAHTTIPYAREAAALLSASDNWFQLHAPEHFSYWARVVHFEKRYRSINQLLWELPVNNILELSSGFSLRGLEAMQHPNIHYIDTDLPGVIELKQSFIQNLQQAAPAAGSQLELLPLNALDTEEVYNTTARFPSGPITIVNEGLLMYLDQNEKKRLCNTIHQILSHSGGYWITADIYIKNKYSSSPRPAEDPLNAFFDAHRITEKMFNSFEEAEEFFNQQGFTIDKEARIDASELSALPRLLQHATQGQLHKLQKAGRLQTTWRLKTA